MRARRLTVAVLLSLVPAASLSRGDWWPFGGPEGAPAEAPPADISWGEATGDAFVEARRTGRPILVYVTSERCTFCRKMERETWSDPEVAQLVSAEFVPLKLRPDTHPEEVATLRVRAFPTTVLVAPDGRPLAARTGYLQSAKLVELLRPALAAAPVASR